MLGNEFEWINYNEKCKEFIDFITEIQPFLHEITSPMVDTLHSNHNTLTHSLIGDNTVDGIVDSIVDGNSNSESESEESEYEEESNELENIPNYKSISNPISSPTLIFNNNNIISNNSRNNINNKLNSILTLTELTNNTVKYNKIQLLAILNYHIHINNNISISSNIITSTNPGNIITSTNPGNIIASTNPGNNTNPGNIINDIKKRALKSVIRIQNSVIDLIWLDSEYRIPLNFLVKHKNELKSKIQRIKNTLKFMNFKFLLKNNEFIIPEYSQRILHLLELPLKTNEKQFIQKVKIIKKEKKNLQKKLQNLNEKKLKLFTILLDLNQSELLVKTRHSYIKSQMNKNSKIIKEIQKTVDSLMATAQALF